MICTVFLQHLLVPWESRTLGHREGKLATAAGISVKGKENAAAQVRYPKWRIQAISQEMGLYSAVPTRCLQPGGPTRYWCLSICQWSSRKQSVIHTDP